MTDRIPCTPLPDVWADVSPEDFPEGTWHQFALHGLKQLLNDGIGGKDKTAAEKKKGFEAKLTKLYQHGFVMGQRTSVGRTADAEEEEIKRILDQRVEDALASNGGFDLSTKAKRDAAVKDWYAAKGGWKKAFADLGEDAQAKLRKIAEENLKRSKIDIEIEID